MKVAWAKIKQFLLTPYGKAYLVFITLTKLYLVYRWAMDYVKRWGSDLFEMIGAPASLGEEVSALSFTALCLYYTVKAIIGIFRGPAKPVEQPIQA
ncbi:MULTISPECIES: hypothetical protein [Ferrimonas]|uniref:hypothetical protein n=1 Tax=Ferrimonas TaxID=44011 RepID=UPI0006872F5F|nr:MULTISPECIES: hypothetical protein [Ferrimonas]USD39603.1 hypothetical protein J8Z22_11200 [Ferrimonas sp. SCSIO 43195]